MDKLIGIRWWSFKHDGWAVVTNEPVSVNGFYTIEFPELGIYRRYNKRRINREIKFLLKAFKEGVLTACVFDLLR